MRMVLLLTAVSFAMSAYSQETPPEQKEPLGLAMLRRSQVGVQLVDRRGDVHFRATVIARDEKTLQLLTAAHCITKNDVGDTLKLSQGERSCAARITRVVRNPSYEGESNTEVPGADNAFVELEPQPSGDEESAWIRSLSIATISTDATPGPSGDEVSVFVLDQQSVLRRVRGANLTNPRWIEWGEAYRPIPGDSGSGVFLLGADDSGQIRPVLIGVVTDRSQLGGGASVVFLRLRWLAEAMFAKTREAAGESR